MHYRINLRGCQGGKVGEQRTVPAPENWRRAKSERVVQHAMAGRRGAIAITPRLPAIASLVLPEPLVDVGVDVVDEVGRRAVYLRVVHDVLHVVVDRHPRRLRHHRRVERAVAGQACRAVGHAL